jgi:hypothetical protein
LEIRISRKGKPYTTCLVCGIQTFFRGKRGIRRLQEILDSRIFSTENGPGFDSSIVLFNRIQQLRAQKRELEEKQGLIFSDPDLEKLISIVDNEIKSAQGDLEKLAQKSKRGKSK